MLVLKRKSKKKTEGGKDESVFLLLDGKVIAEVTVLKVQNDGVRLGFKADKEVNFIRSEVFERQTTGSGHKDAA